MKYFLSLIVFTLLLKLNYAQQPGTLDPTFANSGILTDALNSSIYIGNVPTAVQQDGKIIVGSYADVQNTTVFRVTRYLSDGTLDVSFGDKGNAYGPLSYGLSVSALALQPNGKILALDGNSGLIARFTTDGILDSSFGTNGSTQIQSTNYYSLYAMLVQPDGKILLGGSELYIDEFGQVQDEIFVLFRIMPDGAIDESFGKHGLIKSNKGEGIGSLIVQPDGKIVAGGNNFDRHFHIERYLSDGTIDKGFGENGSVETTFEAINKPGYLSTIALQKDGKIVATGANDELTPSLLLACYNSNGQLDKTFNDSGKVITHFPVDGGQGVSVLIMPNDKIVIAGNNIDQHPGGSSDFALVCYNDDGSLDQTFGDKGFTVTDIGGGDVVSSAALQPDGKIVVAGISYHTTPPYYTIGIARYNGFDNSKQPLLVRIKRWMQHHGISWQGVQGSSDDIRYYSVQRSTDGIAYKEIARVNNRLGINNYEDAAGSAGDYYRLTAVAKDGSRTCSNAIFIDASAQVKMFPNPARDNLQLQGLPANSKTNVSVMDLNGNVRSSAMATGTNYSVNTASLTSGNYLLKIQHGGTATTLPFVKE